MFNDVLFHETYLGVSAMPQVMQPDPIPRQYVDGVLEDGVDLDPTAQEEHL